MYIPPGSINIKPAEYQAFLKSKSTYQAPAGIEILAETIHGRLFPFQRDLVRWAARKGRAAIFADTGLGKTNMQLEWARLIGGRSLIVAPLSVARQTVREARKIDQEIYYTRDGGDLIGGINITNYEMIERFNPADFNSIVLDECFPPDTLIDVVYSKNIVRRCISDIIVGDEIINAGGIDNVTETHKRRINRAVCVSARGDITCSENHPFFTLHGWRSAKDLRPGDYIMETETAMRLVRGDFHSDGERPENAAVLREILFSEMENEAERYFREGSFSRSGSQEREEKERMVEGWIREGIEGIRADSQIESYGQRGNTKEGFADVTSDEPQTYRARWKRNGDDQIPAIFGGASIREMDTGIFYITGNKTDGIPDLLQGGYRQSRLEDSHRGGWTESLLAQGKGREERCYAGFVRVDSVEILEQTSSRLDRYRDENGDVYFYDIKAERHPSFSVNGLLVHNSSILKGLDSKTRERLTAMFAATPYRLCCTATPAPNDISEIANHAEFLGIMTRVEMLATFFIHDDEGWRLKGHAQDAFYRWLASWGMSIRKPSDLGYDDNGYNLPPLNIQPVWVQASYRPEGQLFFTGLHGITDRTKVRRDTLDSKIGVAANLVNNSDEQWIVWCGLNDESEAMTAAIDGAIEIAGSDNPDRKAELIEAYQDGRYRVMVTKARIAGFGMNFQNCHNQLFVGLSDSFEAYYQCIRRSYRFGQDKPVNVHIVLSDAEQEIYQNVMRKEQEAKEMAQKLIENVQQFERAEIDGAYLNGWNYQIKDVEGNGWRLMLGDSVERLVELEDESIGLSVFSPPFQSLYAYSPTERDLGNSKTADDFYTHFGYIIDHLYRVTIPGRVAAVHVADIPAMLVRDGYIGLKDFSGDVIRAFQAHGWIFDARVPIDKNQVVQSIRTHSKALTMSQFNKDTTWMRPALPDYILKFRKPGENPSPVRPKENLEMTQDLWIEWANPTWPNDEDSCQDQGAFSTWFGISESDTLQGWQSARGNNDEKHICPLQLGTIERCIKLWSNPGDVILSPFAGIGSEGYQAVKYGRAFIGIELKPEYFRVGVSNLERAERDKATVTLFDMTTVEKKGKTWRKG